MRWNSLVLPIRGLQIFLSFVVLGLSAYVANWYNVDTLTASPSQVNFLIFVPLFSILSIIYLEGAPRVFPRGTHPFILMGLEALNLIFYFAGMIALSVFLSTLLFCRGTVCGAARADAGLAGLQWLLFVGTLAMSALDPIKQGAFNFRRPGAGRAGLKGGYPKETKEMASA